MKFTLGFLLSATPFGLRGSSQFTLSHLAYLLIRLDTLLVQPICKVEDVHYALATYLTVWQSRTLLTD